MSACDVCAHARGSWPASHHGTHCRGCHRSWTSTAQAHCARCHEHFTTAGVFELHWPKDGHVDPATAGLYLGSDGIWSTSADRDPQARAGQLAAWRQNARITPRSHAQSPATAEMVRKYPDNASERVSA